MVDITGYQTYQINQVENGMKTFFSDYLMIIFL